MRGQMAEAFKKSGVVKKHSNSKKPGNKKQNRVPKDKPNLGWLFYRDYFENIDFSDLESSEPNIKEKIEQLLDYSKQANIQKQNTLGNETFELTTIYPGLLLGSGYLHELPDVKGQAILGFDFDYTTGLPVMRGSGIKGVLSSAFEHTEYIQELLDNTNLNIKELKEEIFEKGEDIFFDALVVNFEDTLLSDDYITPHKKELKNPKPLRFIKVSPKVTFRFEFKLTDTTIDKETKKELFKNIILDFGLGAKTNVGYGQFTL